MSDTNDTERQEPAVRDVILSRDESGEPSWTVRMRIPSPDLIALVTGQIEEIESGSDMGLVISTISDVLHLFVRPLIVDDGEARAVSKELYRMAHAGEDWMAWIVIAAIFGDFEATKTNREGRRAASRSRGKGGRGGGRHGGSRNH